jgi:taurine dioxygenase
MVIRTSRPSTAPPTRRAHCSPTTGTPTGPSKSSRLTAPACTAEALPNDLRTWADEAVAIHSAQIPYAPDGTYGESDAEDRSMAIITDESAYATQTHRLVREHPETGARTLYSCIGYIIGIEGMDDEAAKEKLIELYHWQAKPEFHYVHEWKPNMLTMWDNRCVLHRVTGGFEGHERLLHRTTIGYNELVRAS